MSQPCEYSGYLRAFLRRPDTAETQNMPAVIFGADDLAGWRIEDNPTEPEWNDIRAECERGETGVVLRGHFGNIRRIDALGPEDPSFWVPLSSRGTNDDRFPIDAQRFCMAEVTYRCLTPNVQPAWVWHYDGGMHFDGLAPGDGWRTVVRRVSHAGFPARIDGLTFRLYSTARANEELEIRELRFREMTSAEREACDKYQESVEAMGPPAVYPSLDAFMPIGVYMKARFARDLASSLGVPFRDYWRLAMEDIARAHHNCIALEEMDCLSATEWNEILGMASAFQLRVIPVLEWPLDDPSFDMEEFVERYVRPHADSESIFAWLLDTEPSEHHFHAYLKARALFEDADTHHPLVYHTRDPNAVALFAPHFNATGISHFRSHAAWDLGRMVRAHVGLAAERPFWVVAPAYVYATSTPEWSTCPETRLMINLAFASGGRGWFTFAYHNPPVWNGGTFKRSLTGPFLTFGDLWAEIGHRMERFSAMAPVLMGLLPCNTPPHRIELEIKPHSASHLPEGVPAVQAFWLSGEDFHVLYLVNNDVEQVTSVNLAVPDEIDDDIVPYDLTDFVRSRNWKPMSRCLHREMFPGQGQVILFAASGPRRRLRRSVVDQLISDDRRQIGLDLTLARRYDLDIAHVQKVFRESGVGEPLEELVRSLEARQLLVDLLYRCKPLTEVRSKLIQISAVVCACDGALCRIHDRGRFDEAYELGRLLLPITRDLTVLQLKMRRGQGAEISADCDALADRALELLKEIRAGYPQSVEG